MKVLGVVLCGGKSSRMGTDKGMLRVGDITWAEIAFNKLNQVSIPVVVSVNTKQYLSYLDCFSKDFLVEDLPFVGGPLNGILSVHQKYPDSDLLVLACDMVNMELEPLQRLLETASNDTLGNSFYVYKNNGYYEPLCAVYKASALSEIYDQVKKTDIGNYSMKKILDAGKTLVMDSLQNKELCFNNYNEPDSIDF
jgi:molybdopterin-guanine dinucleotide biosynthesis protein A